MKNKTKKNEEESNKLQAIKLNQIKKKHETQENAENGLRNVH